MPFYGRRDELNLLTSEFDRPRSSMIVVYGRRRVGKSALLFEAVRNRPHLYFQAANIVDSDSRTLFVREIRRVLGDTTLLTESSDWSGILGYLQTIASINKQGLVVVLDEFPYLCESNPALPSILVEAWERVTRAGVPLKLVLCGSGIAFMEELLAEKSPLRGLQTAEFVVEPLSLREAAQFVPLWNDEDKIRAYAAFGGIPHYLTLIEPDLPLDENIINIILKRGAPLHEEPEHLLQAELRSIGRYTSILRAIADGYTEHGDILGRVRDLKNAQALQPYLRKLERLKLVRRQSSIHLKTKDKTRQTRYYLDDPFLSFWHRFVLPNMSALKCGKARAVYAHDIVLRLNEYIGGQFFESLCQDYVRLHGEEILGVPARDVGKIWTPDYDIDVAGTLLNREVVFGECKWTARSVSMGDYDMLTKRAEASGYYPSHVQHYLVFARSGCADAVVQYATKERRTHLIGLAQLLRPNVTGVRLWDHGS